MTTPPFDPTPTEPVPALHQPAQPAAPPTFAPPEPGPVAVAPVAAPKRASGGSSKILNLALAVAVLVAAAGVAFAVGRATAPAASTGATATVGQNGQNGTGSRGNGFPNGSFDPNSLPGGGRSGGFASRNGVGGFGGGVTITGTVESVAADSITIKLESGQTVTVGLDNTTTYHQQAPANAADVTAGKTVQLQLSGGFRPGQNGTSGTSTTLGTAGSVTIVP